MKAFTHNGSVFQVSPCGMFLNVNGTGWRTIGMFKNEIIMKAKQA